MENKKNTLVIILVIVIAILCLVIGWLLGSKFADKESEMLNNNIQQEEVKNENVTTDLEENNTEIKLNNYDVSKIQNIEVEIPVKVSTDPEMKKVIINNKEEIKQILLNVDEKKEIGKVPEGISFMFNVKITINYDSDPSVVIIILDNGNVAINQALGVGETSYVEYEIQNKSLATELINIKTKYKE